MNNTANVYCGNCDVCGQNGITEVRASRYGALSLSYCKKCFEEGLEPYNIMVNYIAIAGRFPEGINECYINDVRYILNKMGKTEEQFIIDVDEAIKNYREYEEAGD